MAERIDGPRPVEDGDNAEFLGGWREGRLLLQQGEAGGPYFFYPRPICPHTWSDKLVSRASTGRGRVISYSLVYRPNHPAFLDQVPIILAEIELEEGARLLARIICSDPARVRSQTKVKTLAMPEAAKYPLPTFEIVPD